MAMRRDIADLRTTFSVAGVDAVVSGAKASAAALGAVGKAASDQARAAANAASAGAAAAAAAKAQAAALAEAARVAALAQVAAAEATAAAQAKVVESSRAAAKAARARYDETKRLAEETAKAELASSEARGADRSADLRKELADLDARAAARKAASEKARQVQADMVAAHPRNLALEAELKARLPGEKEAAKRKNVEKRVVAENGNADEDTLSTALRTALREAERKASATQRELARVRDDIEVHDVMGPDVQRRIDRTEAVERGRAAQDAPKRAAIEERIAAVQAEEAAKLSAVHAASDAKIAEARRAADEAEQVLARETAASEAAAGARAKAAQDASAAEVKAAAASREATVAALRAKDAAAAESARAAAAADAAPRPGERDTEAAVRVAKARYEAMRKAADDTVRREQGRAEDSAYGRRFQLQDESASIDAEVAARKKAREILAARIEALPKSRPGSSEISETDLQRRDLEIQLYDQTKLDRRLDRNSAEEKRGVGLDIRNLQREVAERVRLVREAEEARVAEAARALDEVKRLLAQETIAAKDAAAAQAEAAKEAARARVKAAAEAAAEIDRMAAKAKTAGDRVRTKREIDATVVAGMADPDRLRAQARSAAEDYAAYAAKAGDKLGLSRARVSAARGTDREGEVAEKEARSARGVDAALSVKERAAARYATALAEVERRLAAVQAEADRTLRATQAEAARAAASIERIADAASKVRAQFADARSFRIDLDRGLRNPRQTEALAKAWAAAYERAVARVVKAAAEAQAAISAASGSPEDLARAKAIEVAKVEALQKTADRVGSQARRSGDVWKEVERIQTQAARAAAKAQEDAATRSAKAWERAQKRLSKIKRNLPSLFGNRPGLYGRLVQQGTLSTLGGAGMRVGRMVGGLGSMAGSAVSGVFGGVVGLLGNVIGMAGKATGAVLGIGVSAVTAAGRIAIHLGQAAMSVLGRLASTAMSTATRLASLGKTIVIRALVVGGGAAVAGYAAAKKAVGDAAEATRDMREGAQAMGATPMSFQALAGAAKSAGVDMRDFQAATAAAKEAIYNIDRNPALADAMVRMGVTAKDADGRMLDVGQTVQNLMSKLHLLPQGEQWNILNTLFGGPENVMRMGPLLGRMARDTGTLSKAFTQQRMLGSLILPVDVKRMFAFNAATSYLKDAVLGLKLAIARTVGADIIAGMYRWGNLIAVNRMRIAGLARDAFDVAKALGEVVMTGAKMGDRFFPVNPMTRFAKGLLDATYYARALVLEGVQIGREFYRAFVGIREQQRVAGQVFVDARGWVMATVTALFVAQRAAASTLPFFRELWATVRGRDDDVVRFPWLITLREGVETVGRFGREMWSAIKGDTGKVTEFPMLLAVRSGVMSTFTFVRDFAREAWEAISGGGAVQREVRFPFLFAASRAVADFVANVRATAADLINVWNGFDPETALGGRLRSLIDLVVTTRAQVGAAWEDLKMVFDGIPNAEQVFNFPGIKTLALDFEAVADRVKKAWNVFSGFYTFFDNAIQRMSFGKLDLATVAMTTAFLTLFGVTRVVVGGIKGAVFAAAALRGAFGRTAAAAAGGAGGAGLVGALGRAGSAAETAGQRAAASTTLWGRLGGSLSAVASRIASSPALLALLGIGGSIAGGMIADMADPEKGTGKGYALAGGGLQGAAMGAALGSLAGPVGAAVGGGAGLIYGVLSSQASYDSRRLEALKAQLKTQGRGDLAARVDAGGVASSGDADMDSSDREALSQADAEVARAVEGLGQTLTPVGTDIAAIREHIVSGGGYKRSPMPASDYSEMTPGLYAEQAQALAAQTARTEAAAAAAAAADRRTVNERYRDIQSGLTSSMRGIMANDPMRSPPPVPAPVAAPAPAGAEKRASLDGTEAMFVIKTADGKDRPVRASFADASAIRDELNRGITPPTWATT